MILDIRYRHGKYPPEQVQKVRLATVYPCPDVDMAKPELVIHFYHNQPTRWIELEDVLSITVSND